MSDETQERVAVIKTIVTSTLDLETMKPHHEVQIDHMNADLPKRVVLALSVGGVRTAELRLQAEMKGMEPLDG